jgi:hypothetical protein
MNERGLESFELSWSTDRLATSQVLVINLTTGQETLTTSDNILRTNHTISLRGLSSQTTYRIQGISQAEDGGKATSLPMDVTTL